MEIRRLGDLTTLTDNVGGIPLETEDDLGSILWGVFATLSHFILCVRTRLLSMYIMI